MTSPEHDSVKAGVADAWDFWLSQHDVSVPATIHSAVKEAVGRWLDVHGADLVQAAIAEVAASHMKENPPV